MLFICHAGHDQGVAEWVHDRLRAEGFTALFLDFDPEQGIPPGRDWEQDLYAQLRRCDGLIFLASSASVRSAWCFAEVALARSLSRPVFPLVLEPNVNLPLLGDVQRVDLGADGSGFTRLVAGLRAAGLDARAGFAWDGQRSPYPGLAAFDIADAAMFFGRTAETEHLLQLLQPTLQQGRNRFVAIVGPSGSGKSSLLRAGLLPRLLQPPGRWIVLPPIVPGDRPIRHLAAALARAFAGCGRRPAGEELLQRIVGERDGLAALIDELADLARGFERRPDILIVVDQAEQLITQSGVQEQQAFLSTLRDALASSAPVWVVATLRAEYLSSAPDRAGLAEAVDDLVMIEPLTGPRLAEVIQRPAQRAGLSFAPGLPERMITETSGGDALPLLAYTLRELARRAGSDGVLTTEAYEDLGGVVGALRRRADQLADELRRAGHGSRVLPTLVKLATVSPGDAPTARRVRRGDFDAAELVVIDAFVDAALLVSDRDGATADAGAVIQVRHEALLRQWPPLRDAIETDRADLQLRSELERLAADWQHGGVDESYLLRGHRLALVERWASDNEADLGPTERRFVEASRTRSEHELAADRRAYNRLRLLSCGLAVLLLMATVAGVTAWRQNDKAQQQARLASSRQLESEANRLLDTQPDVAILAGLQSMSLARDEGSRPSAPLITALSQVTHASRLLNGHAGRVAGVAFSPDGRLLASSASDGTVHLWDTATGRPKGDPLAGPAAGTTRVAFSPDGRLVAAGGGDGTVRIWETATGQPHGQPLAGGESTLNDVAFSPDGSLLVSADSDGSVRLWEVGSGLPHGQPLNGPDQPGALAVAFSPDGAVVATGTTDGEIQLWDVSTGRPDGPTLTGIGFAVFDLAFSPDGRQLASTSLLGQLELWDVAARRSSEVTFDAPRGGLFSIAFSPDGRTLASGGVDQKVRLWDATTGTLLADPLLGHTSVVYGVAFSPDGQRLATAGADQTVRLWDFPETDSVSRSFKIAGSELATSPDGRLIATGAPGEVQLWDAVTGRPGRRISTAEKGVGALAFSPDGGSIAVGDYGDTAQVWNVTAGQPTDGPLRFPGIMRDLAFSPDGRLLAVAGGSEVLDSAVQIWDVSVPDGKVQPLVGRDGGTTAVAFSPDGRLLATVDDRESVGLWDAATGERRGGFHTTHEAGILDLAFSPDSTLVATASEDSTVELWNAASGTRRGNPLNGHTKDVRAVAFSPDGRLLASAGADRAVRLWDVATGTPHGAPMIAHSDLLGDVSFASDGKLITADDETVRVWDLGFRAWVDAGCRLVNRNLSAAEWEQFAPGLPYQRTCPGLPPGDGAPPDAVAALYLA